MGFLASSFRFSLSMGLVLFMVSELHAEHDFSSMIGLAPNSKVHLSVRGVYDSLPPGGYYPVRIEVENTSDKSIQWDIVWATRTYRGSIMSMAGQIEVPAHGSTTSVWVVPSLATLSTGTAGANLNFDITGSQIVRGSASQYSRPSGAKGEPVAIISKVLPTWWKSIEETAKKLKRSELQSVEIDSEAMVADWRTLAGFSAIILPAELWAGLSLEKREALLSYVAQGGRLILATAGEREEGIPMGRFGLGEIVRCELGDTIAHRMVTEIDKLRPPVLSEIASDYRDWELGKLVQRFPPSYLMIVGIMVLFGITVGPINFLYLAKEGARHRLFFTTPIIALVATLSMFLLIVFNDGLGGEGHRLLVVFSTPETQSISLMQEQVSRTGLLSSTTFSLDPKVLIQPINVVGSNHSTASMTGINQGLSYRLKGDRWEGDWFRSRTIQAQYLAQQVSSRAMIEVVEKEGESPMVQSYFETPMEGFFYRDTGGRIWKANSLTSGQQVRLTPAKSSEFTQWWNNVIKMAGPWLNMRLKLTGLESGYFFGMGTQGPLIPTLVGINWKDDQVIYTGKAVIKP